MIKNKILLSIFLASIILTATAMAADQEATTAPNEAVTVVEQVKKDPLDEIAKRMTIIKLAEGSNDATLIAEAELARQELVGYQEERALRAVPPKTELQIKESKDEPQEAWREISFFLLVAVFGIMIGFFGRSLIDD